MRGGVGDSTGSPSAHFLTCFGRGRGAILLGSPAPGECATSGFQRRRAMAATITVVCPDAVVCLHCGYNTMTRLRLSTRKVHDTTQGDYFLWLLPGFACALGVLFLVVFDVVYCVFVRVKKGDSWVIELFASGAVKMWI